MAAIDFPPGPSVGQAFTAGNGVTYTWNGLLWVASGASAGGDFCATQASGTVPAPPSTLVTLTVFTGNSGGWFVPGTGRYTPPAGRYQIFAQYLATQTAASHCDVYIRKNGSTVQWNRSTVAANGYYANPTAVITVDANGTDWFDCQIAANAGATCSNIMFGAFPISGIKGPPGDPTPGTLLQTVSYQTGAVATGTTIIPTDDTIPQISEGTEFMTLAIMPRSATSKLIIEVVFHCAVSVAANATAALFQDSTANALATSWVGIPGVNATDILIFRHTMTSGTTSATTFRVRAGPSGAATLTFNGVGGARFFGGVMASSIVIQEVAA